MKIGILVNQIERQSIEELLGENLLYNSLKERGADVYILDVTTNSLSMTEDTIKSSGLDCFINKII